MITKINKIKNLGIFKDYSVSNDIPDFKRFNLIYGLNASGKTTFSEIFTMFNGYRLEGFHDVEYKFVAEQQSYSQSELYDKNIRVFNKRYISENVDVVEGTANSIIILGKQNIELNEKIEQDEQILGGKKRELELKEKELSDKEREKNGKFTDVARTISEGISGVSARTYNKKNAENAYRLLGRKQILSNEEKLSHSETLRQEQKEVLTLIDENISDNLDEIVESSKALLGKTVETMVNERLKDHPDISKWVEEGIDLHKRHESNNCEFCDQPLPGNRIPDLLSYFNAADKSLKRDIDSMLSKIRALCSEISELKIMDKANLYSDFQEEYVVVIDDIAIRKGELLSKLASLVKEVDIKKQRPL
ncbi:AAA family ATPase [Candidatus Spongiihabitans sp.]|uniref:AAA family ATPase n=1 Tax=Candidatus Spongiihabitans sp. TaxID=3101308 RepID=UPI003C7D2FD8